MRRIILFSLFIAGFSFSSYAQVWLELGVKGMMGMTGFYNKNIVDDSRHDSQFGLGLSVGGVAALNFGEYHGLNFEVLSATHHQSMSFRNDDGANKAVNIEWQSIDAYFMYRWYRDNGAFVEAGPKITYVNEVQQSFGTDWSEVTGKYASRYTSAAIGVGGFVTTSQVLTIKTGIRAEYALTDLVSGEGKAEGYPAPYTTFDSYRETRPFRAGFYMELTFGVGGIAKSMCGSRGMIWGTGYN